MKKLLVFISIFSMVGISTMGQGAVDALRYSRTFPGGTARSMSMGGAFGALGGDFTSLSINPAGLGVYRASEFTITPTLYIDNVDAKYLGSTYNDFRYNFMLNNLGYVANFQTGSSSGLVSFSLGFGYNRLNDFSNNTTVSSKNENSSYLKDIVDKANSALERNPTDLVEDIFSAYPLNMDVNLFWNTYLLNYYFEDDFEEVWTEVTDLAGFDLKHAITKTITEKGGLGEYAFSFAGNIDNQLYVGATVGVQSLSYELTTIHSEWDELNMIDRYQSYSYKYNNYVKGTGYNFKAGLIYKPINQIRLGAAIHTPTFFRLTDETLASLDVNYDYAVGDESNIKTFWTDRTKLNSYNYNLSTPIRLIGSLGIVFDKNGLLSVDYEYADYSKMRLRASDNQFSIENEEIQSSHKATHNVRLGGEIKLGVLALRAGYAFYQSPLTKVFEASSEYYEHDNHKAHHHFLSAGLGVRGKNMFFDMGVQQALNQSYLYVNALNDAKLNRATTKIFSTIGFRF